MKNLINTKIRILNADHSKAFQEHVFSKWGNWKCGSIKAKHLTEPYLYINNECAICFDEDEEYFVNHPYREITFDLLDAWDGSGLPPVGTVCEYIWTDGEDWRKCEVVAHYFADVVAVDVLECTAACLPAGLFRPIKTPEQTAAEDRLHAIDEMNDLILGWGVEKRMLAVLYDAGYRKTEVKK